VSVLPILASQKALGKDGAAAILNVPTQAKPAWAGHPAHQILPRTLTVRRLCSMVRG